MALSKIAKKAKTQFLKEKPHLYDNHSPVSLDEHLELIETYFRSANSTKRRKSKK
jgi:hypothetical protein